MTAGLRDQHAAGARVVLAPAAIAGLLGAALLIGGLVGIVAKSGLDAITTSQAAAPVAAATGPSRLDIERGIRIAERATREAAATVAVSTGPSRLDIERGIRIAERATGQAAAPVAAATGGSRLDIERGIRIAERASAERPQAGPPIARRSPKNN